MREILFRGKRIDNGEWVEGAFLNDRDGAFYICPAVSDISYGDNGNRRRIGCWYKVDNTTVGQYTGLKDKNGNRIFEWDVLLVSDTDTAFVGYDETAAMFMAVFGYADADFTSLCNQYSDVKVVGNIHDNPELMEEDDG